MRLIVGITGATGSVYGIRLLQALREAGVETHLIVSKWGLQTLLHETGYSLERVRDLADSWHQPGDQGAAVSSGSFVTDGMVVAPCSMRTLASIAHGTGEHLVHRAADVILKERRKLALVVREAPFSEVHLENMLKLARMGVTILPPVPAFYNHPQSIEELVDHTVMRILDQFGIHVDLMPRWDGAMLPAAMQSK
ncbi:MAG TPA: UbiX family flavin prenyltransferase [Bryobacteraceae bacterium]|nr:UbiX family flavin prenyltransferase [Bryobacteraceae bacterium]